MPPLVPRNNRLRVDYEHIALGFVTVYLFGQYNIHWVFAFLTFVVVFEIDVRRKEKLLRAQHERDRDHFVQLFHEHCDPEEPCEWVNTMIEQIWGFFSASFSQHTCDWVLAQLNNSKEKRKFTSSKFDLGASPPRIDKIKVYRNNYADSSKKSMQVDVDLTFNCDGEAEIKPENRFDISSASAMIHNFSIKGLARIEIVLDDDRFSPKLLEIYFIQPPVVDLSISPGKLGVIDAMDFPIFRPFLKEFFTKYIISKLMAPDKLTFRFGPKPHQILDKQFSKKDKISNNNKTTSLLSTQQSSSSTLNKLVTPTTKAPSLTDAQKLPDTDNRLYDDLHIQTLQANAIATLYVSLIELDVTQLVEQNDEKWKAQFQDFDQTPQFCCSLSLGYQKYDSLPKELYNRKFCWNEKFKFYVSAFNQTLLITIAPFVKGNLDRQIFGYCEVGVPQTKEQKNVYLQVSPHGNIHLSVGLELVLGNYSTS